MKRIMFSAFLALLILQCAAAQKPQGMMWGEFSGLPSVLHLTAAQQAHYNAYWKDMDSAMMKDHQSVVDAVQKIFTPQQWSQFQNDMKKMGMHNPKTDADAQAMMSKEADALLLTSNQASQFQSVGIRMFHQKQQLVRMFLGRLQMILTKPQQKKLSVWAAKQGLNS